MTIITNTLPLAALRDMAARSFGDMVKAVVDIERELLAVDAELHADLEASLLADGSSQDKLWGINLYPDEPGEAFIEYDSLINIRPREGNRSRTVQDPALRRRIMEIVHRRITR